MKRLRDLENLQSDKAVQIDMSPLIDMVFLLLIFFMVTSVFVKESAVKVDKPTASSAEVIGDKNLMFSIDVQGIIYHSDQPVSLRQVRAITAREMVKKQTSVVILSDSMSHTGTLMDVIDECKLAGAKNVSIAAKNE